jgi:hypothetical protein
VEDWNDGILEYGSVYGFPPEADQVSGVSPTADRPVLIEDGTFLGPKMLFGEMWERLSAAIN